MKFWFKLTSFTMVLALVLALGGCQTYGQSAGLGAGLGAATGAIIGNQSGHAGEGALIGALVGGATGLIAHDIKARKQRSQAETVQAYNYQPSQGEMLTLERTEILPTSARPGEMIEATIQYALLGAAAGAQVREERTLMRGDQVVSTFSTKNFSRDDGTWVSALPFRLPSNLQPGQYTVLTKVNTAQSAIAGRANFTVY